MTIVRRSLVTLALVLLSAAAANAQNAGMTSSGGNSMRPADAPVVRVERPSLREIVERLVARAQWRPASTVVSPRSTAKRKTR